MKIFRRWILFFITAIIIGGAVVFALNVAVDPYGVFGDKIIKWYSYDMCNNPRIGKIAYLDEHYQEYNSYIIGGSKSSSISPQLLNEYYGGDTKFYSMMMYGGEFYDYENTVKYLIDNYDVENIIIHMSTHELSIYNEDPRINNTMKAEVEGSSRLKYYWRFFTLDTKEAFRKLEGLVRRDYDPLEYGYIIPETGVYDKSQRDLEINETEEEYIARTPGFDEYLGHLEAPYIDDNLRSLKNIKDYCDSHGVSFMFIVGATSDAEVQQFDRADFDRFLRGAAEITDYWNFSGYSSIGNDARNFYDPLHYTNRVGEMILARIFGNEQISVPEDFGFHVTKENVDQYLATRPQAPVPARSKINVNLPVLMYHHIEDEPVAGSYTTISDDKFREDMEWFKDNGFTTIFFDEAIDYIEGRGKLPEKPVIITFDDGYLSNYEYAYPLLEELDMKATIFIIGWSVGRDTNKDGVTPIYPHFTWEQAREMYESGHIDIQSHTYDMHYASDAEDGRNFLRKDDESYEEYIATLKEDSDHMKALIKENTGSDVKFLSYPYGEFGEDAASALKELGYEASVTTADDTNSIYMYMHNLYNLNRINVFQNTSMESIRHLLEGDAQ